MNVSNKFIQPIIDRNEEINNMKVMSPEEKLELIKDRFGLHHGKGKRKNKKYKNKGR